MAGWALGVAFVITLLVVMVDEARISDSHPSWIAVPELVLGAAFVGAAPPRVDPATAPPRGSRPLAGRGRRPLASALSRARGPFAALNPKVVALALGSALSLAEADANTGSQVQTIVLFSAIGVVGSRSSACPVSSSRIARVCSSLG